MSTEDDSSSVATDADDTLLFTVKTELVLKKFDIFKYVNRLVLSDLPAEINKEWPEVPFFLASVVAKVKAKLLEQASAFANQTFNKDDLIPLAKARVTKKVAEDCAKFVRWMGAFEHASGPIKTAITSDEQYVTFSDGKGQPQRGPKTMDEWALCSEHLFIKLSDKITAKLRAIMGPAVQGLMLDSLDYTLELALLTEERKTIEEQAKAANQKAKAVDTGKDPEDEENDQSSLTQDVSAARTRLNIEFDRQLKVAETALKKVQQLPWYKLSSTIDSILTQHFTLSKFNLLHIYNELNKTTDAQGLGRRPFVQKVQNGSGQALSLRTDEQLADEMKVVKLYEEYFNSYASLVDRMYDRPKWIRDTLVPNLRSAEAFTSELKSICEEFSLNFSEFKDQEYIWLALGEDGRKLLKVLELEGPTSDFKQNIYGLPVNSLDDLKVSMKLAEAHNLLRSTFPLVSDKQRKVQADSSSSLSTTANGDKHQRQTSRPTSNHNQVKTSDDNDKTGEVKPFEPKGTTIGKKLFVKYFKERRDGQLTEETARAILESGHCPRCLDSEDTSDNHTAGACRAYLQGDDHTRGKLPGIANLSKGLLSQRYNVKKQ